MAAINQIWPTQAWPKSLTEEAANTVTHGAGLLMSIGGLWKLLSVADGRGTLGQVVGVALFGGSMVVLYLASTLYHAVQRAGLKKHLRVFDHAAIYLLIAGTYTPFFLALPGPWPTWGLGAIWLMATAGVCFKLFLGVEYERLSMTMYMAIGWFGILAIQPLVERIHIGGVTWLVGGGVAYTLGIYFFVRDEAKYSHAVWHVFVVLGSAIHYGAIALYVVPLTFA
jgi:hemolysin III